jgi:F-type H+-transporting ATPase subunit delta
MSQISPKNIAEAIYRVTEGKSASELSHALKRSAEVLRDKRMLGKSEDVLFALSNIVEKKAGIVRVKVSAAKDLDGGERKKLENEIKEKYKARAVKAEFFEKAELLGGMRIEVGDEVLDTTYKNKLRQLEKFLIKQV